MDLTRNADARRAALALLLLVPALGPLGYLLAEALRAQELAAWFLHYLRGSFTAQLLTSLQLGVEALAVALLAGVPPALALARRRFLGRGLVAPLMLAPLLFAPYVTVGLWSTGFATGWWEGLHGLALQQGLACAPYVFILFRVAAARLPSSLGELAAALGAGPWARLWRVQLPLLAAPLAASCLVVLALVLGDYAAAARLGIATLSVGIHTLWLASQSSQLAALLCLLLIGPVLAFVALATWAGTRLISQNPLTPAASAVRLRPLGPLAGLALWLGVLVVFSLGFALPEWLVLQGLQTAAAARTRWASLPSDAWNAAGTALLSAAIALLLALALLALLRPGARAGWIERLPWLFLANLALPSLVLALAFLMMSADGSLGARLLGEARDSRLLISTAEALRFFPLLMLPLLDALRRLTPGHIELAQAFGDPPWRARWRAFAGHGLPALGLGLALVLLESLRSLDLSLTLQPFGYSAPPLKVYAFSREQMMDRAAPWVLVTQALMLPAWTYLAWRMLRLGERPDASH